MSDATALMHDPFPSARPQRVVPWAPRWRARTMARRAVSGADNPNAAALSRALSVFGPVTPAELQAAAGIMDGMLVELFGRETRQTALCLAALAAALFDPGVHLCTTSDAETAALTARLSTLCNKLGLTLGAVTKDSDLAARQAAYRSSITIVAATELAIDVLRSRQALGARRAPLALKVARVTGQVETPIVPALRRLIISDAASVLLEGARKPVVLFNARAQPAAPETLRQAVGLASKLDWTRDIRNDAPALTETGLKQVAQRAHLYPALSLHTDIGRHHVCEAAIALRDFQIGVHCKLLNGRIVPEDQAPDGQITFDAALPYLEAANGLKITPRKVPVARSQLQQVLDRYPSVAGIGLVLRPMRRELRRRYATGGVLRVGRSVTQAPLRTFVDADAIARHIADADDPIIIAPGDTAVIPDKSGDGSGRVVILLTAPQSLLPEARQIEAFRMAGCTVERVVDVFNPDFALGPGWLRRTLAALPTALRDRAVAMVLAGHKAARLRSDTKIRAELTAYDGRLDDMLSFAGEPE